jgi:hypothetical protein
VPIDDQTFRMPRWRAQLLALITLVSGVGSVFLMLEDGLDPITLTVATVAVLLGVGTLDRLRTRVTLRGEEIIIVHGFRRRRLFRGHIDSVHWHRKRGLSLRLDDGLRVKLPDVGDGRTRAASIRAWVERGRRAG